MDVFDLIHQTIASISLQVVYILESLLYIGMFNICYT